MHLICSCVSRYFPAMISTDVYTTILYYSIYVHHTYYACSFSSVAFYSVNVCQLKARSRGTYTSPCARTWAACRQVLHIQFCSDWK